MQASLTQEGRRIADIPLEYAGESSTYKGELPPVAGGRYQLQVVASDPANANFGMHLMEVTVE